MQLRQEFLVHEPKLLAKGALLENLFDQQFWLLNKKFLVRNSFGAACVRSGESSCACRLPAVAARLFAVGCRSPRGPRWCSVDV